MAKIQELSKILPEFGFSAVRLWRSSLKPLRILEAPPGQKPQEITSNINDMLEGSWMAPQIQTDDVADFLMSQKKSGGFKITADVAIELLAKIGVQGDLEAGSEFAFEFKEPILESVNIYELLKSLGGAVLNQAVSQHLQQHNTISYVIIRSLKSKSVKCHAQNKKDANFKLTAKVTKLPVGGDITAEAGSDGSIELNSTAGKELVFGIDFYRLDIKGAQIVDVDLSKHLPVAGVLGDVDSSKHHPVADIDYTKPIPTIPKLTLWNLELGEHIAPTKEYLSI
jgi:hypothetical protein